MERSEGIGHVEVFSTDVSDAVVASRVIGQIHQNFSGYQANFDLEDCDRILRIVCKKEPVQSVHMVMFLKELGVHAEVLPSAP